MPGSYCVHRPGEEFTKLSDHLVAISAQMDVLKNCSGETLAYIRGFRKPETNMSRGSSDCSGDAQNVDGLRFIRKNAPKRKVESPTAHKRTTRWFASASLKKGPMFALSWNQE